MSNNNGKKAAGYAAAELVEDGMKIGLGTGSTAYYFIERLIERYKEGLNISAIATSQGSEDQARQGGIEIIKSDDVMTLDLDIDGADEIDEAKRMIKGGGGALLREKVIAASSKEMIIVIDESKWVTELGRFPLAVEIIAYAYFSTIMRIEEHGFSGKLRLGESGNPYLTDSKHYIFDIQLSPPVQSVEKVETLLLHTPGVVETGFFFNLAGRVIIGYNDGHVEIK